jgi:hypothetical protein
MNRKKELKRLPLVLSLLLGPFVFICLSIYFYGWEWLDHPKLLLMLLIVEAIGFVVVWIIYGVMCLIVKGFLHR